jgi:hypothetical protein
MLHSMGKRMRKWFGWHRGLFALQQRESNPFM